MRALILIPFLILLVTVFDLRNEDRLQAWRDFRESLETSTKPYQDVARFWSKTPYNTKVLDTYNPGSWPDPWELVINNRYDLLAICLGICYTFQLTARFNGVTTEIYTSIAPKEEPRFMSVIDKKHVLNYYHGEVVDIEKMPSTAVLLWTNETKSEVA